MRRPDRVSKPLGRRTYNHDKHLEESTAAGSKVSGSNVLADCWPACLKVMRSAFRPRLAGAGWPVFWPLCVATFVPALWPLFLPMVWPVSDQSLVITHHLSAVPGPMPPGRGPLSTRRQPRRQMRGAACPGRSSSTQDPIQNVTTLSIPLGQQKPIHPPPRTKPQGS